MAAEKWAGVAASTTQYPVAGGDWMVNTMDFPGLSVLLHSFGGRTGVGSRANGVRTGGIDANCCGYLENIFSLEPERLLFSQTGLR